MEIIALLIGMFIVGNGLKYYFDQHPLTEEQKKVPELTDTEKKFYKIIFRLIVITVSYCWISAHPLFSLVFAAVILWTFSPLIGMFLINKMIK